MWRLGSSVGTPSQPAKPHLLVLQQAKQVLQHALQLRRRQLVRRGRRQRGQLLAGGVPHLPLRVLAQRARQAQQRALQVLFVCVRRHRAQQQAAQAALPQAAPAAAAARHHAGQHAVAQGDGVQSRGDVGQAGQPRGLRRGVPAVAHPRQHQRQDGVSKVNVGKQAFPRHGGKRLCRRHLPLAVQLPRGFHEAAGDGGEDPPPRRPQQARQVVNHRRLLHRLAPRHVELRPFSITQALWDLQHGRHGADGRPQGLGAFRIPQAAPRRMRWWWQTRAG